LESKPWCFIATAVFGADAPETVGLRHFRDRVLRRSRAGCMAIATYYRWSPAVALYIHKHPAVRLVIAAALSCLVQAGRLISKVSRRI